MIIGGAATIDLVRTGCLLSIKNIDVHSWLSQKFWDNSGEFVGLEFKLQVLQQHKTQE